MLNNGGAFGPGGEGFFRLNIGCPRKTLEEGLNRIKLAVEQMEQFNEFLFLLPGTKKETHFILILYLWYKFFRFTGILFHLM